MRWVFQLLGGVAGATLASGIAGWAVAQAVPGELVIRLYMM